MIWGRLDVVSGWTAEKKSIKRRDNGMEREYVVVHSDGIKFFTKK